MQRYKLCAGQSCPPGDEQVGKGFSQLHSPCLYLLQLWVVGSLAGLQLSSEPRRI